MFGRDVDWPPWLTTALGLVGTVGMTLVAGAGALLGPRGPAGSMMERAVDAVRPSGSLATVLLCSTLIIGIVLVSGAWLGLGVLLRRGSSLRPLVYIAIAWALPLVAVPPIYSRDVYSYAAVGRMVDMHLNPYRVGPAQLGSSPFVAGVGTAWLHTPSPYGPLFVALAGRIVELSHGSVGTAVVIFRLVSLLSLVVIALALPILAVKAGKDPARAFWLGVCNPVVLVLCIASAHNDTLMIALVLAGLVAASNSRYTLGVFACALAGTIKVAALLGVAFIAVEAIRALPPTRRWAEALKLGGVTVATFAVAGLLTGLGFGWVNALGVPGTTHFLLTPTTATAQVISSVFGHESSVLAGARAVGYVIAVSIVGALVVRAPRLGTTRACGLALAATVAFGPIALPWYALWGIVPLAAAGRRVERGYAIIASLVLLIAVEPSGSGLPDLILIISSAALAMLAILLIWRPFRRWIRTNLAPTVDVLRYERSATLRYTAQQLLARPSHRAIED